MDTKNIDYLSPKGTKEHDYLIECADRLSAIFSGAEWSPERGLALILVLNAHHIHFSNLFTLGDATQTWKLFGYAEAEAVVAAICDNPRRSPEWWRSFRLDPGTAETPELLYHQICDEIVNSTTVDRIDPPHKG